MTDLSPEERANQALANARSRLEDADDVTDPAEIGQIETDALETLADGVAQAFVDGLNRPAGYYAGILVDDCKILTKTNIKARIKDRTEELATDSAERQRLDEYLQNQLQRVIIHQNTDAKQGAKYSWDFDNFQVQTESGKDGRGHFSWPDFRDYLHESGGPNVAKPEKDRRSGDDWRDFMLRVIEDKGEKRRIKGERTQAVEKLQNEIRQQTGYGTVVGALEYSGVWVRTDTTDVPDWWQSFGQSKSEARDLVQRDVCEIRVHESLINTVTSDPDVTRHALYQELDARNHTVPGSGGPSTAEYVDGSKEIFWTLLPSVGVPRVYVPDPYADGSKTGSLLDDKQEEGTETTDDSGFDGVGEIA